MNDFRKNINKKRTVTLKKILFDANDYSNYGKKASLAQKDAYNLVKEDRAGFTIEFSRTITSDTENYFSIIAAFDIGFTYIKPYTDVHTLIDRDALDEMIKKESEFFTAGCMSKISLIISEISVQLGTVVPIVTPPLLVLDLPKQNH